MNAARLFRLPSAMRPALWILYAALPGCSDVIYVVFQLLLELLSHEGFWLARAVWKWHETGQLQLGFVSYARQQQNDWRGISMRISGGKSDLVTAQQLTNT